MGGGLLLSLSMLGLGVVGGMMSGWVGGVLGFFRGRAFFPLAPRRPHFTTGQWIMFDWARQGWGQARTAEETGNAIAIGDGMVKPCFQIGHPNHSSSYVIFDRFFFVVDLNHGAQRKIDRVANRDRGCSSTHASLAYPIKY